MSRLKWPFLMILRYYRNLGLRVSLYAAASILTVILAPFIARLLPRDIVELVDFAAVNPVLTILASSMLAVSTFSLNIMVSSHMGAAAATTPRVHRLLLEDTLTQSVLATFIGAFVFSLGSFILIKANLYAAEAAVVVMGLTMVVALLVVLSMLRWIEHLKDLGSVDRGLRAVSARTEQALKVIARYPAYGARVAEGEIDPGAKFTLASRGSGYLQMIHVDRLANALPEDVAIHVTLRVGDHVLAGQTLACLTREVDESFRDALLEAFVLGDQRSFEQDARIGLTALSEIASRALSPGINDPGTAIEAIARLKSLLWTYDRTDRQTEDAALAHVFVRPTAPAELIEDAFMAVARDAAGMVEVGHSLRAALAALAHARDPRLAAAARDMAARAVEQAEHADLRADDLARLRAIEIGAP